MWEKGPNLLRALFYTCPMSLLPTYMLECGVGVPSDSNRETKKPQEVGLGRQLPSRGSGRGGAHTLTCSIQFYITKQQKTVRVDQVRCTVVVYTGDAW